MFTYLDKTQLTPPSIGPILMVRSSGLCGMYSVRMALSFGFSPFSLGLTYTCFRVPIRLMPPACLSIICNASYALVCIPQYPPPSLACPVTTKVPSPSTALVIVTAYRGDRPEVVFTIDSPRKSGASYLVIKEQSNHTLVFNKCQLMDEKS